MNIVCPKGANINCQQPKNWDVEKYGKCHDLPVRQGFAGTNFHDAAISNTSAWKPTAEELVILNQGGYIEVLLLIPKQCPMMVSVPEYSGQRDTLELRTVTINEDAHGDDHHIGTYDEHGPATP